LTPVVHNGVRYTELRGSKGRGLPQNGGYIAAVDTATNKELWVVRVYEVAYDKDIEDDKRDVYITRLELRRSGERLLIENERQERFALNLKDRTIERLR
jgi:hypothetical protein